MSVELFGANLKMMDPVQEQESSFSQLERLLTGYKENGIENITPKDDRGADSLQVIVFAPFTHLQFCKDMMERLKLDVSLGAQGCSEYDSRAHTSQISPRWLREIGVSHVLIGHSEVRDEYEALTKDFDYHASQLRINQRFNRQIKNALDHGLDVVYCVGEKQNERREVKVVIEGQMRNGLEGISPEDLKERLVVAYEPRWAIGGEEEPPTQDHIRYVNRMIRLSSQIKGSLRNLRIIYGGSVNSINARGLLANDSVSGGLVGSASLDPEEFGKIISCMEY